MDILKAEIARKRKLLEEKQLVDDKKNGLGKEKSIIL